MYSDSYGFAIAFICVVGLVLLILGIAYLNHNHDTDTSDSEKEVGYTPATIKKNDSDIPVNVTLNMLIELLIGIKSLKEPSRFNSASTGNSIFTWRTDTWKISLTFNSDNLPVTLVVDSNIMGNDMKIKY